MARDDKRKRKNSKQFNQKFRKRFPSRKYISVFVLTAVILVVVAVGYYQLNQKAARYQKTIDELNTEIQEIRETNEALEEEKNNLESDEFREKMARERLGMISKDEFLLEKQNGITGSSSQTKENSKNNNDSDSTDENDAENAADSSEDE